MTTDLVKYPVGEQSFQRLREEGFLYVDKTRYIDLIVNGSKYYFLGRPRRFGKSLFLSTLKCFFEGRRELFKDLYINSTPWDWEPYPVLYLDLNIQKYKNEGELDDLIEHRLIAWEKEYEIEPKVLNQSIRFSEVIRKAAEKTGKGVVILVDEYDKPLVNNLHDRQRFDSYRAKLAEIYSNFKSSADYLRLVFMTGVSRFGKLSVFSDLNNISDISLTDDFAAICGITQEELLDNFGIGINETAIKRHMKPEEVVKTLKCRYDGYHFAPESPDIYNPFSLLNTFKNKAYGNYWIESGTPSLLVEQLKRTGADIQKLMNVEVSANMLAGLDLDSILPAALFYQTGYLTIKAYDDADRIFTLGIPNDEVREGLLEYILPYYANLQGEDPHVFIVNFRKELQAGDVDSFMRRLQAMFASMGYDRKMDDERSVQNALFILFYLLGLCVQTEFRTSYGRIDILVRTDSYVYIIELKYNKPAEEALLQIKRKEYTLPWVADNRKVIAIGINYSSSRRCIDSWKAEVI